jgi:hypothetical protein
MDVLKGDKHIEFRNEYDHFKSVYYKGQLFSGVFIDDNERISYKNGLADGEYLVNYDDGSIQAIEIYKEGEVIASEWYYRNGKLSSKWNENFVFTRWNEHGQKVQKDKTHYFPNGNVCYIQEPDCITFFTPDKKELYKRANVVSSEGKHNIVLQFNDDLMHQWYFELLQKIPNEYNETLRKEPIYHWLWRIHKKDQELFFEMISRLLEHPNLNVVKTIANIVALHRFHDDVAAVIEENNEVRDLITELTKRHDKSNPNRDNIKTA